MPIAVIHILKGRSEKKKASLIKNVTQAIVSSLEVPKESVRVILSEMSNQDFGIAGLPVNDYRKQKKSEI